MRQRGSGKDTSLNRKRKEEQRGKAGREAQREEQFVSDRVISLEAVYTETEKSGKVEDVQCYSLARHTEGKRERERPSTHD